MQIIPIFIPHLGCPNDCVFCNQRRIAAPSAPTAEQVRQEVMGGLQYSKNPQVAFYGGSFTALDKPLQEAYLQAVYPFVSVGQVSDIRVSTRPDCIDTERLALLKQYGVSTVELGAQSMFDEVLAASNRGHTMQDVVQGARLVKEHGFVLGLQQMIGLPLDSGEKTITTAQRLAALEPDFVRIYPVCVIENTSLADQMKAGIYTPLTIEQAVEQGAQVAQVYEDAGISIIRIGLNPTEELSGGAVLGGAYHPSLGEMVYSRKMHNTIRKALGQAQCPMIAINPKDVSLFRGQKNTEYHKLLADYPKLQVVTREDIPRKTVKILEK